MELRHLRCFLAVAEELHFARAAERLHIEQSPLSRAIKELEVELGAVLFARTTRSTRLTLAGRLFLEHVRRVFTVLEQARDSVKAAANGFHGQLRVALSDGITPSRLPALLALCRQEEPELELRFFEVPLSQQIKGLHDDLYDVGFAQSDEVGDSIAAIPVWRDALIVTVPARHPLLAYKRIPSSSRFPWIQKDSRPHKRQKARPVLRQAGLHFQGSIADCSRYHRCTSISIRVVCAASLLSCSQLTSPASPLGVGRESVRAGGVPAVASEKADKSPPPAVVMLHTPPARLSGWRAASSFDFFANSREISCVI